MRNESNTRVLTYVLLATLVITTGAVATSCVPVVALSTYLSKFQNSANYATYNVNLQTQYYKWPGSVPFRGAKQVTSGGFTNCTRDTQKYATYTDSQCVQFARQVSNFPGQPSTAWRRSVQLDSNGIIRKNLAAGVLVATMDGPGGLYASSHPHVAVFLRIVDNQTIEVADQNFVAPYIVGKHHRIRIGGSGFPESDAARFWTIYVSQ